MKKTHFIICGIDLSGGQLAFLGPGISSCCSSCCARDLRF